MPPRSLACNPDGLLTTEQKQQILHALRYGTVGTSMVGPLAGTLPPLVAISVASRCTCIPGGTGLQLQLPLPFTPVSQRKRRLLAINRCSLYNKCYVLVLVGQSVGTIPLILECKGFCGSWTVVSPYEECMYVFYRGVQTRPNNKKLC